MCARAPRVDDGRVADAEGLGVPLHARAVSIVYRLLKFGGAKRILFLVDRGNLGKQTEDDGCFQLLKRGARRRPCTPGSSPPS